MSRPRQAGLVFGWLLATEGVVAFSSRAALSHRTVVAAAMSVTLEL